MPIVFFVLIPSPVREGLMFLVITGVQFFRTELKSVRKVCADANLNFHKILITLFVDPIYPGCLRKEKKVCNLFEKIENVCNKFKYKTFKMSYMVQ